MPLAGQVPSEPPSGAVKPSQLPTHLDNAMNIFSPSDPSDSKSTSIDDAVDTNSVTGLSTLAPEILPKISASSVLPSYSVRRLLRPSMSIIVKLSCNGLPSEQLISHEQSRLPSAPPDDENVIAASPPVSLAPPRHGCSAGAVVTATVVVPACPSSPATLT